MSISADQVRAATRAAAAVITADTMPPLRLDEPSGGRVPVRQLRAARFVPLAAAAAVVIAVAGSAAAGSWLSRSGSGHPGTVEGSAFSAVPAFYVEVASSSLAVVRATATGATLARITTRTPFVGVAGAADDRTFVLDAQRQVMGPMVRWPGQPAFYLLRLSPSGTEESLTRLALQALPAGAAVTGLALSADGSKLAVAMDLRENFTPGRMEIRVYTLADGTSRTWFTNGSEDAEDPGGFTGSGVDGSESVSWAADSRTLAFDWSTRTIRGVRLLDTAASGDDLIADSRLAVTELSLGSGRAGQPGFPAPRRDQVSVCVTDSIISLDGSAIVCGYTTLQVENHGYETTTGFIRYPATPGRQPVVSGVFRFKSEAPGDISLYWTSSTGKILIGGILKPGGIQVGVINGGKFTPLPGITGLGAAAW